MYAFRIPKMNKTEGRKRDRYGQFSVKTPTPVHPLLKVRKPWQIWFIFSLQDVLERKKYKNGRKNIKMAVFWFKIGHF
jgi:hypothetical protein